MSRLVEQVETAIVERRLLRRGQGVLVGISGGIDSMVLLRVLHSLAQRHRWKLTIAHFNHCLRGRSSDADERLVVRTVKKLRLPMVSDRADVRCYARGKGCSLEMAARRLRHEFFARTASRLKIGTITLAHHADDQVELFFLRLFRGAGSEGLAGMKWCSPSPVNRSLDIVRPMLDQTKKALLDFARTEGVCYREDASNASMDILRNRIRGHLLPLLRQEYQPSLNRAVLRTVHVLAEEAEFVREAAERWLKHRNRTPFARLPVAVQRRCLQWQLWASEVQPDFDLIEQLRQTANRQISIRPGQWVTRDTGGRVQLHREPTSEPNQAELAVALKGRAGEVRFDGARICWHREKRRWRGDLPKPRPRTEVFDADRVGDRILLRHWRPGDRFQPIGMGRAVKLQDWFTNEKVPRVRRHHLVVGEAADGRLFWIEGMRISECFKLDKHTVHRLKWLWQRT